MSLPRRCRPGQTRLVAALEGTIVEREWKELPDLPFAVEGGPAGKKWEEESAVVERLANGGSP